MGNRKKKKRRGAVVVRGLHNGEVHCSGAAGCSVGLFQVTAAIHFANRNIFTSAPAINKDWFFGGKDIAQAHHWNPLLAGFSLRVHRASDTTLL